ncbi:acyl-CoA-binding protein (ACBP)/diazepam binding inhibitor (DBI)/endozepine (EP) [Thecaphora frezii]
MSEAKFQKAVQIVGSLPKDGPVQPTQDDQLKFYGLYKQATVGDVNTTRPGLFDLAGKYKWDAWKQNEGKSKEQAQQEYVDALLAILEKHKDAGESVKYIEEINSA